MGVTQRDARRADGIGLARRQTRGRDDLAQRERFEQVFLQIVTATSPLVGEAYVRAAPRIIAEAWGCSAGFITEMGAPGSGRMRLMSLSGRSNGSQSAEVEGYPWCGDVPNATVYYPSRVSARFPEDAILRRERAEVYLAVPFIDSAGATLGYAGLIDDRAWPAAEAAEAESMLRLLAPRAGAELERYRLHERAGGGAAEAGETGMGAGGRRVMLENLPDQLVRLTLAGDLLDVVMPTSKSSMVCPFPRVGLRRNVAELMPSAQAETLLNAMREATRSNRVTLCSIRMPYEDDERDYEMRIVPLGAQEVLVYARDGASEQWSNAGSRHVDQVRGARIVRGNPYGLTFREVAVLELLAEGAADKEIASKLGVSVFTVYKHVSKILHKMDASSRTEASLRTVRERLFE